MPGYGNINRSYIIDQPFAQYDWTSNSLSETIIYTYYAFFYQLQITGEIVFSYNQDATNVYYNPNYRLVNSSGQSSVDTSYAISTLHNYSYVNGGSNVYPWSNFISTVLPDPTLIPYYINGYYNNNPDLAFLIDNSNDLIPTNTFD